MNLRQQIEEIINNEKWLKDDYVYAVRAMDRESSIGYWPEDFKKREVIEKFWNLIEDGFFYKINNFVCFRNININN